MHYVVTLVSNPNNPLITNQLIDAVKLILGSKKHKRLSKGYAVDIFFEARLDSQNSIQSLIGDQAIDYIFQKTEDRRKKVLIADMDSTMIDQECIDELAAEVGVKDQVAEITAKAMNGEIEFNSALRERVALLKGLPKDVYKQVIANRITLAAGAKTLVSTMKANGAYCALVSGGFTLFTNPIAAELGFHENRANLLEIQDGKLTGEVVEPILGAQAKVEALNDISKTRDLVASDFIAVGDGANDLPMLQTAGTGVALHAKPTVAEQADIKINHGDLTALLYLQGYCDEAFLE